MTILLVILLVIIGLFVWMNGNKTDGDLTVIGLQWVRNINIEENKMFSESGWTLPEGAEQTDARNELHHYDSVLDHYESVEVQRSRQVVDHYETYYTYSDNGNGTFTEVPHERPVYTTEYYTETVQQPIYVQVPRYQTKYYYNIWRWTPSQDVTASVRITTPPGRKWNSAKMSGRANGPKPTPSRWSTRRARKPLPPTGWLKATG